jgi:hypothetical protein
VSAGPGVGAYGLTLPGLERCPGLLPSPGPSWPEVRVARERVGEQPPRTTVDDDGAELRIIDGGALRLDRVAGTATFLTRTPLTDEELAHPYLAPVASYFAGWLGRHALHAGGVCLDGSALGVVGPKEAGKTTTLAWLALQGCEVLADDMLIIDDGRALAGPRALDLRPDAVRILDLLDRTREGRGGERRRLELGPVAHEVRLDGLVFLAWGDRVELTALPPSERLQRIAGATSPRRPGGERAPIDLVRLPAWELRRPRNVAALPEVLDRLLAIRRG